MYNNQFITQYQQKQSIALTIGNFVIAIVLVLQTEHQGSQIIKQNRDTISYNSEAVSSPRDQMVIENDQYQGDNEGRYCNLHISDKQIGVLLCFTTSHSINKTWTHNWLHLLS